MKNKNFVPYSIAIELKKKGFNEPCFGYYLDGELNTFHNTTLSDRINNPNPITDRKLDCTAPLWQQATDWLRKVNSDLKWPVYVWVEPYLTKNPLQQQCKIWRRGDLIELTPEDNHEVALEKGLLKALNTFD